jgi:predicted RNA binding protein YcfA (HicA-like mRNA interferase family)
MDYSEMINKLKKVGFFEVYHKTSFECYRERKSGGVQTVTVEVLDAGSSVQPSLRYHIHAIGEDGKKATGNPADSIDVLLATVHWGDLD